MEAAEHHDRLVVAAFDIMGVRRLAQTMDGSRIAATAIGNLCGNLLLGKNAYLSNEFRESDSFSLYRLSDHFSDSAYVYSDPSVAVRLQADRMALRAATSLAIAICHPHCTYALRCGIGVGGLVELPLPLGLDGIVRIGPAMASAYAIESGQEWIGGAIATELVACMRATANVVAYRVPVKRGRSPLEYAINWVAVAKQGVLGYVPGNAADLRQCVERAFSAAGQLGCSEKAKLNNTLRFVDTMFDREAANET